MVVKAPIGYPAIRYDGPITRGGYTMCTRSLSCDDDLYLIKHRWPIRSNYIPGGILDSAGRDFKIIDLLKPLPAWQKPIDWLIGIVNFLPAHRRRLEIEFDEPVQLSLDQFKARLCDFARIERVILSSGYKGWRGIQKAVKKANSFHEAIEIYSPSARSESNSSENE